MADEKARFPDGPIDGKPTGFAANLRALQGMWAPPENAAPPAPARLTTPVVYCVWCPACDTQQYPPRYYRDQDERWEPDQLTGRIICHHCGQRIDLNRAESTEGE